MVLQNLYKKLELKKNRKIFDYEPCSWVLIEYTQRIVFELLKIRSTGGAVHASFYLNEARFFREVS